MPRSSSCPTPLSAARTQLKLEELRLLMAKAHIHIQQGMPRAASAELLAVIFSRPYCRIADLVKASVAKRETASEYLRALVKIGVLDDITAGREKIFINQRLRLLLADRSSEVMDYSLNALAPPTPIFAAPTSPQTS